MAASRPTASGVQTLTILGSTGSIGCSTLDVVARHPDRFRVHALVAHRSVEAMLAQCVRFRPALAVLEDAEAAARLRTALESRGLSVPVASGRAAAIEAAAAPQVNAVMAAIVGAAGLPAAIAAARAGKRMLLANKEALVMAGAVFLQAARAGGAAILPIDSEHNAVFQCLPAPGAPARAGVRRIVLTASGGPFRRASADELERVTVEQACAHPNWSMGRKISVDSATMMNKGLELIEARLLFGVPPEALGVVVHPQSIVHSLVEYADGSMLAQLGYPDMRTPIAHALAYPQRIDSGVASLDLAALGRLEFEPPDEARFPCLALARAALAAAGAAPCVLNAANEIAVQAFLDGRIGFTAIARVAERTLAALAGTAEPGDLDAVLALDAEARARAAQAVATIGPTRTRAAA